MCELNRVHVVVIEKDSKLHVPLFLGHDVFLLPGLKWRIGLVVSPKKSPPAIQSRVFSLCPRPFLVYRLLLRTIPSSLPLLSFTPLPRTVRLVHRRNWLMFATLVRELDGRVFLYSQTGLKRTAVSWGASAATSQGIWEPPER